VLTVLLELPIQVILLTQDQKTWRDLENLYRHKDISMFQIFMENTAVGAKVHNTSNELLSDDDIGYGFAFLRGHFFLCQ